MATASQQMKQIETRIDSALDVVMKRAVAEAVLAAERQGITFTEDELELIEIGICGGSAMTVEYLQERGWLNGSKMTRDLLAGP